MTIFVIKLSGYSWLKAMGRFYRKENTSLQCKQSPTRDSCFPVVSSMLGILPKVSEESREDICQLQCSPGFARDARQVIFLPRWARCPDSRTCRVYPKHCLTPTPLIQNAQSRISAVKTKLSRSPLLPLLLPCFFTVFMTGLVAKPCWVSPRTVAIKSVPGEKKVPFLLAVVQ